MAAPTVEHATPAPGAPALVLVYNHRYDRNIDALEAIYRPRFSCIYHLMPFYDGDRPNVIPVYENSYHFQGYLAQGLGRYWREEHTHYIFLADDMILNPVINERNYREHFHLDADSSFVPALEPLHEIMVWWSWMRTAVDYRLDRPGLEVQGELPPYEEARAAFARHGLVLEPVRYGQVARPPETARARFRRHLRKLRHGFREPTFRLAYPLVRSYSDLVIVAASSLRRFCHHCGVFAATRLFSELAVPTALVLSAAEIVTEKDLTLRGRALWTKEDLTQLRPFDNQLRNLLSHFPSTYLYLHPVKLSRWNTTL